VNTAGLRIEKWNPPHRLHHLGKAEIGLFDGTLMQYADSSGIEAVRSGVISHFQRYAVVPTTYA
jgi:hypothetical protein